VQISPSKTSLFLLQIGFLLRRFSQYFVNDAATNRQPLIVSIHKLKLYGANIEIMNEVGEKNMFIFGLTATES